MELRTLRKLTAPLARRIALMVSRAVVTLVDDSLRLQGVQIRLNADETMDAVERFQNYGFTAHPHPGAEGIAMSVGGHRSHAVVIAVDDRRYRMTALEEGEAALYDDLGQVVHLTRGGIVVRGAGLPLLVTDTPSVTLDTPLTHCTGDLAVDGSIVAQGDISDHGDKSMAGMRAVYDGHDHPENDAGGPTDEPNQKMGGV